VIEMFAMPLRLPKLQTTIKMPKFMRTRAMMMENLIKGGQYPGGVGPGFFTGTYTGDGNATKAITGVGFAPKMILVYPQVNQTNGWGMRSDQDGLNYMGWKTFTGAEYNFRYTTDNVISLDADGFTVGDGTTLGVNWMNVLGRVYSFACWGNGAVSFADGTYAGDHAATQAITGVGFVPKLVMLYTSTDGDAGGVAKNPIGAKTDQDGVNTVWYRDSNGAFPYSADMIISLDADGFTVGDGSGTGPVFNDLGWTYMWRAWR